MSGFYHSLKCTIMCAFLVSGSSRKVIVFLHVAMVTVMITMLCAFKFFFMKHVVGIHFWRATGGVCMLCSCLLNAGQELLHQSPVISGITKLPSR